MYDACMRTFVVLTGVISLLAACTSQPVQQQTQLSSSERATSNISSSNNASWETYTNDKYGFSVKHPPETTVRENEGYIRLQNYVPTDDIYGLEPGQYYLEIHIPSEPRDSGYASCKDAVMEAR